MAGMQQIKGEVQELGDRVAHVEGRMEEYTVSFNIMVDVHTAHSDDISWLKDKVSDLVDRSRRNNIKIRGIPETVFSRQLQ